MRCLDVLSSVAACFTLPFFKASQLVQHWVASTSLWAGAGWWAARVIGRENSDVCMKLPTSDWPLVVTDSPEREQTDIPGPWLGMVRIFIASAPNAIQSISRDVCVSVCLSMFRIPLETSG